MGNIDTYSAFSKSFIDITSHYFSKENINEVTTAYEILSSKTPSCVYILKNRNNSSLKIGITKNLKQRIKNIKGGFMACNCYCDLELIALALFPSISDAKILEKELHSALNFSHSQGEWFWVDKYVFEIIEAVLTGVGILPLNDGCYNKFVMMKSRSPHPFFDVNYWVSPFAFLFSGFQDQTNEENCFVYAKRQFDNNHLLNPLSNEYQIYMLSRVNEIVKSINDIIDTSTFLPIS